MWRNYMKCEYIIFVFSQKISALQGLTYVQGPDYCIQIMQNR